MKCVILLREGGRPIGCFLFECMNFVKRTGVTLYNVLLK